VVEESSGVREAAERLVFTALSEGQLVAPAFARAEVGSVL
jgi:hypothetical protein